MTGGEKSKWNVRVADRAVVVELPRRLVFDDGASGRLADAVAAAVARGEVERVVVLVRVEHPLSAALHDALVQSARMAAASGVTDWHVVAAHERKATAVARELPAVEMAVFGDETQARARAA